MFINIGDVWGKSWHDLLSDDSNQVAARLWSDEK